METALEALKTQVVQNSSEYQKMEKKLQTNEVELENKSTALEKASEKVTTYSLLLFCFITAEQIAKLEEELKVKPDNTTQLVEFEQLKKSLLFT